jgi:ABC-2 type transport system ATP-binding protein
VSEVLVAEEARVAVDGATAIDRLTLSTRGDHVLLGGDARALLAAITSVPLADPEADEDAPSGEAYVAAGSLLLAGKSVAERAHVAVMGAAPLDPPMPAGWTAEAYVRWGARLAGAARGDAADLAGPALARVGMKEAARRRISALGKAERRVLALAQAIVTGPEVLVAEAPLAGLAGGEAALVMRALMAAIEGRKALVSAARLDAGSAEGALARGASHLVVLAGGEVAVEGPPGELYAAARVLAITVHSNAEALREALAARGIALRGGPTRFSAALPEGCGAREVLAAAAAVRAAVVEVVPVLG